jgi:hypothetical protein
MVLKSTQQRNTGTVQRSVDTRALVGLTLQSRSLCHFLPHAHAPRHRMKGGGCASLCFDNLSPPLCGFDQPHRCSTAADH